MDAVLKAARMLLAKGAGYFDNKQKKKNAMMDRMRKFRIKASCNLTSCGGKLAEIQPIFQCNFASCCPFQKTEIITGCEKQVALHQPAHGWLSNSSSSSWSSSIVVRRYRRRRPFIRFHVRSYVRFALRNQTKTFRVKQICWPLDPTLTDLDPALTPAKIVFGANLFSLNKIIQLF